GFDLSVGCFHLDCECIVFSLVNIWCFFGVWWFGFSYFFFIKLLYISFLLWWFIYLCCCFWFSVCFVGYSVFGFEVSVGCFHLDCECIVFSLVVIGFFYIFVECCNEVSCVVVLFFLFYFGCLFVYNFFLCLFGLFASAVQVYHIL
ncbi:unnamed protein product, partial [Mesocestoides corti]|uniref:NADH dehydrogenase subunit 2 n=1 Tax=Mesocestoides corti TaxID=53468 RepID=A0A0R3URM4_MESCO